MKLDGRKLLDYLCAKYTGSLTITVDIVYDLTIISFVLVSKSDPEMEAVDGIDLDDYDASPDRRAMIAQKILNIRDYVRTPIGY
jgi:hypothetical protein